MQNYKSFLNGLLISIVMLITFYASCSLASVKKIQLPADEAFQLSITQTAPQKFSARFNIANEYYLYKDRMSMDAVPSHIKLKINYPKGTWETIGSKKHEVYAGLTEIPITLQTKTDQTIQFHAAYQGCSKQGFCYPPIEKTIALPVKLQTNPINKSEPISFQTLLKDQNSVLASLHSKHFFGLFLLFVGLGLLLAFTPCVLPMVPILTSIIVGQRDHTTPKAFFLSLAYVTGMAVTYASAGVTAAMVGSSLQVFLQTPLVIGLMSGLFILLALSLFGFYELSLPNAWQNRLNQMSNKQKGGTYAGVFLMGVLATLVVSPCVTAPLVGVLLYISQTGDTLFGAAALFAIGVGMGLPLLLIGTSAGKWLPKSGPWMEAIKKLFGFFMIAMAVWMFVRIIPPGPHSGLNDSFVVVNNLDDFEKALHKAKEAHQPVLLDFYADWCESCVAMEKKIFQKSQVKKILKPYVMLRANLSKNTRDDQLMLKHFAVIAPPTVLFFDKKGCEIDSHRIVGEVGMNEFVAHVKGLWKYVNFNLCKKS